MQKDTRILTSSDSSGKQTEHIFFEMHKKSFFSAIKWNTFESFFYQLILITHQTGLFFYCDSSLYGKAGSLFAFSYFMVTIVLCGFEGGLLPFFQVFISCKKYYKKLLLIFCARQIMVIFFICMLSVFTAIASNYFPFDRTIIFLIGCFIAVESTKKMGKHLLYLAFYNRYTALMEIAQITGYVTTIWGLYFYGIPFSLPLLFIPFIIWSSLFCLCTGLLLARFYKKLPNVSVSLVVPPTCKEFFSVRCAILMNQLCRSLFSTNFLVPLFALHGGFSQAGIMTFANYLTNTATFFIYKICIPPAEGLLSRLKHADSILHYKALRLILTIFCSVTTVLAVILFSNSQSLALLLGNTTLTTVTSRLFLFFFFIHVLENMFIVYERFLLLQHKLGLLTIGNLITCGACVALLSASLPFFTIVIISIFIRFLFFSLLSYLIFFPKKLSGIA